MKTDMTIGDAIRLEMLEKKRGVALGDDWKVGCALQGALFAVGVSDWYNYRKVIEYWPWMQVKVTAEEQQCRCPYNYLLRPYRYVYVTHLFDVHKWSSGRIADWLDSIDPTKPKLLAAPDYAREEVLV